MNWNFWMFIMPGTHQNQCFELVSNRLETLSCNKYHHLTTSSQLFGPERNSNLFKTCILICTLHFASSCSFKILPMRPWTRRRARSYRDRPPRGVRPGEAAEMLKTHGARGRLVRQNCSVFSYWSHRVCSDFPLTNAASSAQSSNRSRFFLQIRAVRREKF